MKKQIKAFLSGMLVTALTLGLCVSAFAISGRMTIDVDPINIQVKGKVFQPKDANGNDVAVFAYNGTTYAPLRALAEAYGLEVGYDASSNMATVAAKESIPNPTEPTPVLATGYGVVTGMISYKYNNYIGNRGDTGAKIIIISKDATSLPDSIALGVGGDLPVGVYMTEADGNGNYTFDAVPAGEYYVVVISKSTNENPDYISGYSTWGKAFDLFSEKGKENALLFAKVRKTKNDSITVYADRTTTFSYDFGITYLSY